MITPENIGKHLVFLDQSPLQQADDNLEEWCIPFFCSRRYGESKIIVKSGIDVWENMKTVKFWMGLPNLKQANEDNKSYQRLKSAIKDPLSHVKFRFFAKTAAEFNKFLVLYQAEKPMVPFIGQSLEDIICSFAPTFMLAENLKAAKTCLCLPKINFNDRSSH